MSSLARKIARACATVVWRGRTPRKQGTAQLGGGVRNRPRSPLSYGCARISRMGSINSRVSPALGPKRTRRSITTVSCTSCQCPFAVLPLGTVVNDIVQADFYGNVPDFPVWHGTGRKPADFQPQACV